MLLLKLTYYKIVDHYIAHFTGVFPQLGNCVKIGVLELKKNTMVLYTYQTKYLKLDIRFDLVTNLTYHTNY